jgi:hypothetical protein
VLASDHAGWAAALAQAIGWRGELRRVPRSGAAEPLRGRLDALDLTHHLVLGSARIRGELGYAEPTDPLLALARTIEDEAARRSS